MFRNELRSFYFETLSKNFEFICRMYLISMQDETERVFRFTKFTKFRKLRVTTRTTRTTR